jgi:hypothetical protein
LKRARALIGLLVTAGLALLAPVLRADDGQAQRNRHDPPSSRPADDADLMEFLGGIGAEDDEWIDYLARTDPTKVASAPRRAPPQDGNAARGDPPAGSQQK